MDHGPSPKHSRSEFPCWRQSVLPALLMLGSISASTLACTAVRPGLDEIASAAPRAVPVPPLTLREIDVPDAPGSFFPRVQCGGDGVVHLCWTEALEGGRHGLRLCSWDGDDWGAVRRVAEGDDWFVNWADFPSVQSLEDGSLAAHWLERLGEGPYAYGVRVRCSNDAGESWGEAFWLHTDESPTEHGFATLVPAGPRFQAVWLDGRVLAETREMQLRSVFFDVDGNRSPEQLLDPRVCECCATDAVRVEGRLHVRARDRSDDGVRDILGLHEGEGGTWTEPRIIGDDEWLYPG